MASRPSDVALFLVANFKLSTLKHFQQTIILY
jgi:hypothetical protein